MNHSLHQSSPQSDFLNSEEGTNSWEPITRTQSWQLSKKLGKNYQFDVTKSAATGWRSTLWLCFTSLGVIYGDIGTSPIYTISTIFTELCSDAPSGAVCPTREQTLGGVSLVVWALILTVSIKYVCCILNADYHGEGGTFALFSLLRHNATHVRPAAKMFFTICGFCGAALILGDGVLTPAISVLSAIEGIAVFRPSLTPAIVPVTIIILIILFIFQQFGTASIGKVFGWIMVLWFFVLGISGLFCIFYYDPSIFAAFSPHYGLNTLGGQGIKILGGVVLAITGVEALYADLGHFGKTPIRLTWLSFCFPALIFNYLGQGAILLNDWTQVSAISTFYIMFPRVLLWPIIVLTTFATVIASQAMITGAASLINQAIQLKFFPRVRVYHTSETVHGQVYIPAVNWCLMIGVIIVVASFGTNNTLANAYGMGITLVMVITSILFVSLMILVWHSSWWKIILYSCVFFLVDGAFAIANLVKFIEGAWLPIAIALIISTVMCVWWRGTELLSEISMKQAINQDQILHYVKDNTEIRVPGVSIYLSLESSIPPSFNQLNRLLRSAPQRIVLCHIKAVDVPFVRPNSTRATTALDIEHLGQGIYRAVASYGYCQPNIYAQNIANDLVRALELMESDPVIVRTTPAALPLPSSTSSSTSSTSSSSSSGAVFPTSPSILSVTHPPAASAASSSSTSNDQSSLATSSATTSRIIHDSPTLVISIKQPMTDIPTADDEEHLPLRRYSVEDHVVSSAKFPISFVLAREWLVSTSTTSTVKKAVVVLYRILSRNCPDLADFLHVPPQSLLEIGVRFEVE